MTTALIIGNIFGLIGSIVMIIVGSIKDKNKAILVQTIQLILLSISNLVLGSVSGFIINLVSIIRNILSNKNKLNKVAIAIIIIISTALTLKFNTLGFIGYLPLINNIIFILFMNTKSDIKFKILMIVYITMWLIHDIYIKSYITAIFDLMTIITSFITIFRIKKSNNNNNTSNN